MCGIAAFFSRRVPISEAAVKRGTQSLHYRGRVIHLNTAGRFLRTINVRRCNPKTLSFQYEPL
jgi:hypothetical protein